MFRVNVRNEKAVAAFKNAFENDEMLFVFDIFEQGNGWLLVLEKETETLEYKVFGSGNEGLKKMKRFLDILRIKASEFTDDIDFVINKAEGLVR